MNLRQPSHPARRAWRAAALALLTGLAGAGLALPSRAAGSMPLEWFPLEGGARLEYDLHRDRSAERSGAPLERQFYHGRSRTRVLPVRAGDAGRIRVLLSDFEREANLSGGLTRQREQVLVYSAGMNAVLLHGHESLDDASARQAFDPPLVFLRGPLRPGQRWRVGTLREGGLRIQADAQVLSRESLVVGDREYPDALHLRFVGPVTGSLTTEDGVLAVESGTYSDDLWLVRGIGSVRQVTSIELQVVAGEEKLRISNRVTRTLDAVRTEATAAAPPGPQ